MKKFLTKILVDPVSGKSLLYDEAQNILHTDDDEGIYKIIRGGSGDFA